MKRYLAIFLLVVLLLTGCAAGQPTSTTANTTTPPTETTTPTEPAEDIDYAALYGPWNFNVAEKAKTDGKLHYYFFSNEGIVTNSEGTVSKYKFGDSCLIAFPNGQLMLVDSGVAKYSPVLIGNLQMMGVKTLDYLVISHSHADHYGGAFGNRIRESEFLDQIAVKQVYYREIQEPTREEEAYLVKNTCAQRNIPADFLEQGDSLTVGDVTIRVLWPQVGTSERTISGTADVNNSSIVMRFDYGEHSSLFTGDLYAAGELLSLTSGDVSLYDVDLLKVPHHGHKTSSSDVFLNATTPELAVASGNLNISNEIRERFAYYNIPLMYNYIHGYIHVVVGADGVMETETTRNDTPDAVVEDEEIIE